MSIPAACPVRSESRSVSSEVRPGFSQSSRQGEAGANSSRRTLSQVHSRSCGRYMRIGYWEMCCVRICAALNRGSRRGHLNRCQRHNSKRRKIVSEHEIDVPGSQVSKMYLSLPSAAIWAAFLASSSSTRLSKPVPPLGRRTKRFTSGTVLCDPGRKERAPLDGVHRSRASQKPNADGGFVY